MCWQNGFTYLGHNHTEDTATVATSAEVDVDISREFTDSTPIAMDASIVGASIVARSSPYSGYNPSPPTRAHHTFIGWFNIQDTTGGTEFRANTTINSNVTLWARWRTNPPTILTPHNNATVEHQNLNVTWNLVPNATHTIQMRNLRDNRITLPTENLPAGRGQFTILASALTAGDRHRVAVSAVTPNAINGWDEREFNVRGGQTFQFPNLVCLM